MTDSVSIDRLRELLHYDPETGSLTWRIRNSFRVRVGEEAGAPGSNGRRYVGIDGRRIIAHRVAWAMHYGEWPDGNIAPENGDYLDLRLVNFKLETATETARKGGLRKTNKSGAKGVSFDTSRGKWMAYIDRDYKRKTLGRFDSKEEAIAAAQLAAEEYGLTADREREAAFVAAHAEARTAGLWRAKWQRLRKVHVTNGWGSLDHFCQTVSEQPSTDHRLYARDPGRVIGPENYEWRIPDRPEFDQQTKEGRAAYNLRYRQQNMTALRERDLIRMFGITLADYQNMLVAQQGVCKVCKQPEMAKRGDQTKWLAVDHDHDLGRGPHSVRGLLCSNCNPMIGYGKDDPDRLHAGARYLEDWFQRNRHAETASDKGDNQCP